MPTELGLDLRKAFPFRLGLLATLGLIALAASPLAVRAADEASVRRLKIEQMSSAEQQDLLRKLELFAALPAGEQQRLRELQAELDGDPRAARLHETLERYHEWLKTLSPSQRLQLAESSPQQRVETIQRIRTAQESERQASQRIQVLTPRDVRAVLEWGRELVAQHHEQLLNNIPAQMRKRLEQQLKPGDSRADHQRRQREMLMWMAFRGREPGGPQDLRLIGQQEIATLAKRLSSEARAELDKAGDLKEQRRLVQSWVFSSLNRAQTYRAMRKLGGSVVEEDLVQFFEKELSPLQRERLLSRPPEKMREELRRLYIDREGAGFAPGMGPAPRSNDDGQRFHPGGPERRGGKGPQRSDNPAEAHDGPQKRLSGGAEQPPNNSPP